MEDEDMECRECECGHWESSHEPAGCQEKTDTSCHCLSM